MNIYKKCIYVICIYICIERDIYADIVIQIRIQL